MKRDNAIDIAKSIGIILVVCAHAQFGITAISSLFFMQLFIFLSGYVFNEKHKTKELLKRKIKSLYIPFVIYELIFLLLHGFLYDIHISEEQYGILDYLNCILHIALFDNVELLLAPIWFLTVIFLTTMLFKIILNIKEKFNLGNFVPIVVSLLLMALGLIFTRNEINVSWSYNLKEVFNITLTSLIFFTLGFYIKKTKLIKFNNIGIAIVSVIALVLAAKYGYTVDTRTNSYSNIYLLLPIAIAGIYVTMFVAKIIEKIPVLNKGLEYIGKNTLSILIMHIAVFKVLAVIQVYVFELYPVSKLTGWRILYYNEWWQISLLVAGVIVPLIIDFAVKKTKGLLKKVNAQAKLS